MVIAAPIDKNALPTDLEEAKAELHKLMEEVARRKEHETIQNFFPDEGPLRRDMYPKHCSFMAASKDFRESIAFGGNRCVSPWTLLDMEQGEVAVHEAADGSTLDVVSWDAGTRRTAPMSGWFLKGLEPMFRVVVDSGQFFDCTGAHRLLDAGGNWRSFQDVMSHSSGHRCTRTSADFLASCAEDGYRYDPRLPMGSDSGLTLSPSQVGVLSCTPCESDHRDAVGLARLRSLALQVHGPQSSSGDLRPLAALFGLFSDVASHSVSRSLKYVHQRVRQSDVVSDPQPLSGVSVLHRRTSAWRTSEPFYPLAHPELFGGNKIIAVVPLGVQPVVDATVDGTHCYSSAGVIHHNSGKSLMGAYICSVHLTGEYPHWWEGRRFDKPTRGIACGKEGKIVRDSIQKLLMGEVGRFGTGMIPARCLDRSRVSASRGASGLYDRIMVKHISGGWSTLRLKSYDQGRQAFESVELEFVWEDEEAPMEIHSENLMRTMTTQGIVMNTFTPLLGTTPLVRDLIKRAKEGSVFSVEIPWDDAPHITGEMIDDMMKRYPPHEIAARRYGKPQLGSGAIFTLDPKEFVIPPRNLPDHWPRIYGLDFGWTHPTAAIWGAWDRDSNVLYLYSEHRRSKTEMSTHAAAINGRGDWIRGMSETAGTNISDGRKIYSIYKRDFKLKLKPADKSVEAGIMKMQQRFAEGGIKVFDTCTMWLSEYLTYHRVKGIINKEEDDLMDATRYLIMGLEKYAKTKVEMTGDSLGGNVTEVKFGNWNRRR